MRENSLMALALLGVIIGASGLGFGVYSTMQVQTGAFAGEDGDDGDDGKDGTDGTGVKRTWYSEYIPPVFSNPILNFITINSLNITFNIDSGESVHFLYNSLAMVSKGQFIRVDFVLDGNVILDPYTAFSNGGNVTVYSSLSLQYSNSMLSEGSHEITIAIYGDFASNGVLESVLFVLVYIP